MPLLSDLTRNQNPLSVRLKNKQVLPLHGLFPVPTAVTKVWYTGVAAGGRDASTAIDPFLSNSTTLKIGISDSENICFLTSYVVGASRAPRIDPIGRKVSAIGTSGSPIDSGYGGGEAYAADNGFMLLSSGSATQPPMHSVNSGRTWTAASITKGIGVLNRMAIMPVSNVDAPAHENRACYTSAVAATDLVVWQYTNPSSPWVSATYAGKSFSSMSYANGYFIAGENNATDKTSLYYKLGADANVASGWTAVVVDAVNQRTVNDTTFGGGIYVAFCNGGKIYTASAITGPWTERTSGTTDSINGGKYAAGRFVAVTSTGKVLTSTDGITWVVTAQIGGAYDRTRFDIQYLSVTAQWCLGSGTNNTLHYSTDGATWTANIATTNRYAIAATKVGLLVADTTAVYLIPDPSKPFYFTLSSSGDGGDCRIICTSSGAELLRLAGGKTNYVGGSSTLIEIDSSGQGTGGFGSQGANYGGSALADTGQVSTTIAANSGGACPKLMDLLDNDGMAGIKIPGAAAGANSSSAGSGGGSIMAQPGIYLQPAAGPGGGGGGTGSGGGGGEGVVRYQITVTPGEVLAISNGLAQRVHNSSGQPQHGFGMIEWEG